MRAPIPLLMAIEFLKHHDDDRLEHHLRLGVVGVPRPLEADIESDGFKNPRVEHLWHDGDIELPPQLHDRLIAAAFRALLPTLDVSDIGEIYLADATSWIKDTFAPEDAATVLAELRRHVTPGLVDPNARYTAFVPVRLPLQGETK